MKEIGFRRPAQHLPELPVTLRIKAVMIMGYQYARASRQAYEASKIIYNIQLYSIIAF